MEPAPLEGLDGEGQRMGGDPQEPHLLLAAFLREPPEASDPFGLRLGDELAGAAGGALGTAGGCEEASRRFDRRDQLRAALLQDLGGIGNQASRDIHVASGFLANAADGFPVQICTGVQPLRCL